MRSFSLVVLCIALLTGSAHAQKEHNVWMFGDHGGVDFNIRPPQGIVGPFKVAEGSASISHGTTGQFLFSCDGTRIYNSAGSIMLGLDSVWPLADGSSTQSSLIAPFPRDSNKYFVFFVDHSGYYWKSQGICYVEVDMRGDNGLGEVVTQPKFIFNGDMTEKITAIPHSNECDVWIVTHRQFTNEYLATLIDDSTVSAQPVVSHGFDVPGLPLDNGIGWLVASQQGTQLAYAAMYTGHIEIADFDRSTGSVSNVRSTARPFTYGLCFSPDGTKLYAAITNDPVVQYDLTQSNIAATETAISNVRAASIRPMPDGRLYMVTSSFKTLHVIDQPNQQGTACNVIPNAVALDPGSAGTLGLPNIPDAYIGRPMRPCIGIPNPPVQIVATINTVCVGDCILLEESGSDGRKIVWKVNDGRVFQDTPEPMICFTTAGNYEVELIAINSIGDTARSKIQLTVNPATSIKLESQAIVTDTIGAVVRIPILFNQRVSGMMQAEFSYDPTLLSYSGTFDANGNAIDLGSRPDQGEITITRTLNTDSIVGYIYFDLYWESTACRTIDLVSSNLSSVSTQCLNMETTYEICLEDGCGTRLLSEKLRNGLIEMRTTPNPAIDAIEVSLSHDVKNAHVVLIDANGRVMIERTEDMNRDSALRLGVSSLHQGVYFLSVQGSGLAARRSVVITR